MNALDRYRLSLELLGAVMESQTKVVQNHLHLGANPDVQDGDKKSALLLAVYQDNISMCQILLRAGADVNIPDEKGNTPIHIATSNKNMTIMQLLLEHGAQINVKNERGITPLLITIAYGDKELVEFMQNNAAKVNDANRDGKSPVMIAAVNGNLEIVTSLIESKADLSLKDHNGKDVLYYAALGGRPEIFKLILDALLEGNVELANHSETLVAAAQRGYAIIVEMLLDKVPCDLNFINKMRQSSLHVAVQGKFKQTVKVLLKRDITIDRRDHGILGANTALIYAVKHNMYAIAKLLLTAGAELEKTNVEQKTALYYAAERGHMECVKLLLTFYEARSLENLTIAGEVIMHYQSPLQVVMQSPVEAAVMSGHVRIAEVLLKAGMVRKLKSALMFSARKGSYKVFKCISKFVFNTTIHPNLRSNFPSLSNWQKAMVLAVMNGHEKIVKHFCQHSIRERLGFNFAIQPILQSKTALHLAAGAGFLKIVRLLMRNGAILEYLDQLGNTPFLYAVEMNKTFVVDYFVHKTLRGRRLKQDIDFTRKNHAAIHIACQIGNPLVLKYLLKNGSDPNVPSPDAISAGYPRSVEYRLNGYYPIVVAVMNRKFPATVAIMNATCDMNVSSVVNMISLTPLQCSIKFNDPYMFRCLFWSGDLMYWQSRRQIHSLVATDNLLSVEIRTWLKKALSQPLKLHDFCRQVIRRSVRGTKEMGFETLGLPVSLQTYLLLHDFLQTDLAYGGKNSVDVFQF